jgi:hypothetical protein
VQWLLRPSASIKVAGKSGIFSGAESTGAEPVKKLYEAVVLPIAEKDTRGAWYCQWRLVTLDGCTLDVADTAENEQAFWSAGGQSRIERLSQDPFRGLAGKWHSRAVGSAHGQI